LKARLIDLQSTHATDNSLAKAKLSPVEFGLFGAAKMKKRESIGGNLLG